MHAVLFAADGIICLHKTTVSIPDILAKFAKKKTNTKQINNNVEFEKLPKVSKTFHVRFCTH